MRAKPSDTAKRRSGREDALKIFVGLLIAQNAFGDL
jgi:hypothetical protein